MSLQEFPQDEGHLTPADSGEIVVLRVVGTETRRVRRVSGVNDQWTPGEEYHYTTDNGKRVDVVCLEWFQPAGPWITVFLFDFTEAVARRNSFKLVKGGPK